MFSARVESQRDVAARERLIEARGGDHRVAFKHGAQLRRDHFEGAVGPMDFNPAGAWGARAGPRPSLR